VEASGTGNTWVSAQPIGEADGAAASDLMMAQHALDSQSIILFNIETVSSN